jgi:hypothetical protein
MPLQIRNKLLIFQFPADGIYDYYDMIQLQVLLYNYQLAPQIKILAGSTTANYTNRN